MAQVEAAEHEAKVSLADHKVIREIRGHGFDRAPLFLFVADSTSLCASSREM